MAETNDDRPYRNAIHREDFFLYAISFLLIGFFIVFFVRTQARNDEPVYSKLDNDMYVNLRLSDDSSIQQQFMKAQLQLVYKRYELSTKVARTVAYIKFIGFLVGTLLVLFGCMIVIRGVRNHAFEGSSAMQGFKLSLAVNSPGMFLVFIGAGIMIATILKGIENNLNDSGIAYPGAPAAIIQTDTSASGITILNSQPDSAHHKK